MKAPGWLEILDLAILHLFDNVKILKFYRCVVYDDTPCENWAKMAVFGSINSQKCITYEYQGSDFKILFVTARIEARDNNLKLWQNASNVVLTQNFKTAFAMSVIWRNTRTK